MDAVLTTWPLQHGGYIARFTATNLRFDVVNHGKGATRDEAMRELLSFGRPPMPFIVEHSSDPYPY